MPFDPDQLPVPDLGLSCQHCGYPLAGLTKHRCPECGESFAMDDFIPDGAFPRLIAGGEEVHLTPDLDELLTAYDLPYTTLQSPIQGVFGGLDEVLRKSDTPGPPVGVARNRYLEAIDLIRRVQQDEELPPPPLPAEDLADWTCPGCGETNPGTFGVCWNCQQPRELDHLSPF